MKSILSIVALVVGLSVPSWSAGRAKVSFHPSYRGYTCAARGVPMGSIYEFRVGKKAQKVKVVDACGGPMKGMNRKFDLSPTTFKTLFGSTRRGVGTVEYRLVKKGSGRFIPHYR